VTTPLTLSLPLRGLAPAVQGPEVGVVPPAPLVVVLLHIVVPVIAPPLPLPVMAHGGKGALVETWV
jgi:hypothetical protein